MDDERESTFTYTSKPLHEMSSEERFYYIIDEINNRERKFQDWRDRLSEEPSYTRLKFINPFRYQMSKKKYNRQLKREIKKSMLQQERAIDAVHYARYMAYTTLWPPLHTHAELEYFQKYFFEMPEKDRERLLVIRTTKIF